MKSRRVAPFLAATAIAVASAAPARAAEPIYAVDGVAVSGYDTVAYFTDGRPVKGRPEFEHRWNGVAWRFASAAHREAFAAAPAKYAPQYGGYCAWAVSKNYTYSADPEAWKIVDGRLFLNYDKSVQERWTRALPDVIARADGNWPLVLREPSK